MLELARSLLAYTAWADRRHLEVLGDVDHEHLSLDTGASHGSLLGTMSHILGAEQFWLAAFLGAPLERLPGSDEYPDLAALRFGFAEHGSGLEFFLASLNEQQLASEVQWFDPHGQTLAAPLWQGISHMVQHSGYHRGQMTTMLRQLGYAPPMSDLMAFYAAH